MKLKDKTVLVTGASSGIGKDFALRAAKDGATVILAARRIDKLNEVKAEVEKLGGKAEVVLCDVTKSEDIKNLFLVATKDGRVLDVVLNNAGLGHVANIYELTVEQIEQVIDVNIKGMILVAKYAAEVMVRQKHGHLIFTSSLAGLIVLPQWSVYCASKWAITGFADAIRFELKPFNVQVTTVHPGAVKTEFFDKDKADIDIGEGQAITGEEVAEDIYEILFTNKQKIMMPAMSKNYSFMYKYFPGLVDTMLEKQLDKIKYHNDALPEDEPEFSYILPIERKE